MVDVADKRLALGIDLLGLAAPHRRLALVVEKLAQGVAIGMGKEIRERRERERRCAGFRSFENLGGEIFFLS